MIMYSYLLDEISRAIGARLLLQFKYRDATYIVEPYLLGKNNLSEDCLRAWQVKNAGQLTSEATWQCFVLSEITDLKILEKRFFNKRPGYDPYDNSMSRIYYRI